MKGREHDDLGFIALTLKPKRERLVGVEGDADNKGNEEEKDKRLA